MHGYILDISYLIFLKYLVLLTSNTYLENLYGIERTQIISKKLDSSLLSLSLFSFSYSYLQTYFTNTCEVFINVKTLF